MFGTDFLRKLSRLTIIAGLLIGLCDPASAYDPKASQVSLNTSGFDNNLDGTVDDVQALAEAVDELSTSTPETDPVVAAISGIVKSNGSTISAAVSSTDYAPATSGTAILKGNGSGGFSSASAGVDYLASETDGVIGNEVTGATDGSLTRSGGGTGGSPYTLALNVSNANTWTGQQTFNTSAPVFGTMTPGSTFFAGAGGLLSQDNQDFFWDETNHTKYISSARGSERLTNGTFTGSASGWTVGSGYAYSANTVVHNSNGTAALSQNNIVSIGLLYELTYTISNWTVGSVTPSIGAVTLTARSADGTYTERFLASTTNQLAFTPTNTARFTIDNVSVKQITGGAARVGGTSYSGEMVIGQSASNSTPGTTKHLTFANPGSYSWTEYRFGSNSLGASIGVSSSGNFYFTGSGGTTYWRYGTTSPNQFSYTYSGGLVHSGVGAFGSGIHAGSQSVTKSSMLTVAGGTGFKTRYIYQNTTLDDTATEIYARPDLASTCTGTPSTACSSHASEGACTSNDSHGGCTWTPITCSDYNGQGEGTCESYSGCTYEETNCSDSGWYDQYSCEAADDSYGGSCTYNITYGDCANFNPTDQWACEGNSGCSWYDNSCSSYNGDEGSCLSNGCYYDSGSTNCVGACSGSYESGASCDGTYFTGSCSGSGGSCSGTPSCSGIDDSTSCGAETGCTWSTGLTLTLPPDGGSTTFYRTYWIHNGASATALTVAPNTGQTVNYTTSLSIPALDSKKLTFFYFTQDCSTWSDTSESACQTGHTGCAWTACSTYTDEMSCNTGVCSWDYGMGVCNGGGNCEGSWVITRNWAITADFT